jgi:transposase
MNSAGIDISKGKSTVCVARTKGKPFRKPFDVLHTPGELGKLADYLNSLEGETRVTMEYTGRYYEPVAMTLHEAGVWICVVNPFVIKGYGNNSIRKAKTDKKDARKIANYGLEYWDELRRFVPTDVDRNNLKIAERQFLQFDKYKVGIMNSFISQLDSTFPGVNLLFTSPACKDGHLKWVDFAAEFWHSESVTSLSKEQFSDTYREWCKDNGYNFAKKKSDEIYTFALERVAATPFNEENRKVIVNSANFLTAASAAAESARAEMIRLAETLPEYETVIAMYGVGETTGAKIIAEVGDVRRFDNRKAFVGYSGVDSTIDHSGTHNPDGGKITKRGPAALRQALFQVMVCHLRTKPKDEVIYQFLDKKRSEGKNYYVYMTAGMNKFLRIYYARVKEVLNALDENESEFAKAA